MSKSLVEQLLAAALILRLFFGIILKTKSPSPLRGEGVNGSEVGKRPYYAALFS